MLRSEIDRLRGDVTGALEHARRGMELVEKIGGPGNRVRACSDLGLALRGAGHWEEASSWLEEGRALAQRIEYFFTFPGLALTLLHCGDRERALAVAREDVADYARSGFPVSEVQAQVELAYVAASCGHEAEARAALARASDLAARTECRMLVPAIHEAAATLAAALGDSEQQRAELREAHRLYQALGATGHAERLGRELGA